MTFSHSVMTFVYINSDEMYNFKTDFYEIILGISLVFLCVEIKN